MSNNYKNIVIWPHTANTNNDPKIVFSGANSTVNTDVTLKVYPDSNGTLSFEGSAGQLFSITNDLSGSIFSVNDVSGIPVIDVNASGYTSINAKSYLSNTAPALSINDTWANSSQNFTAVKVNVANTNSGPSSLIMDVQLDNISKFNVRKDGYIALNGGFIDASGNYAGRCFKSPVSSPAIEVNGNDKVIYMDSISFIGWGATLYDKDLRIYRDAANTFAQRNGTAPQTFRVYGSYTDATNYERLNITANSNGSYIFTQSGGTGIARPLYVGANNATQFMIDTTGNIGIGTTSPTANLHVAGNTYITGNTTVNGIGAVYAPNRPAFRVYGSGTTNNLTTTQNGTGCLTSNNWTVDINTGTYLSNTNGVFTAPVTGIYQVNVVGRNSGYTSGISQLGVLKNGSSGGTVGGTCVLMIEFAANSSMNHTGASTALPMNTGDTLALKVLAGEINFDSNDNWSVVYIG